MRDNRIVDRFFRGQGTRAIQLTGTGLWLFLTSGIVGLHGAR